MYVIESITSNSPKLIFDLLFHVIPLSPETKKPELPASPRAIKLIESIISTSLNFKSSMTVSQVDP